MALEFSAAVKLLDSLNDGLAELKVRGVAAAWPAPIVTALEDASRDVELLAGNCDRADGEQAPLHSLVADAANYLPRDFANIGRAFASCLRRELNISAARQRADAGRFR